MDTLLLFGLWFVISIVLLIFIHRYMWIRWVRDIDGSIRYRKVATYFLILMTIAMPVTMVAARFLPPSEQQLLSFVIYSWMGVIFYFLVTMGSLDLMRYLYGQIQHVKKSKVKEVDLDRRNFMRRSFSVGAAMTTTGLSAVSYAGARKGPDIERVTIPLTKLPAGFEGLKIALISDLHVGLTIDRAYVEQVVMKTLSFEPDIIAVTGDMVDGSVANLAQAVAPLAELKARYGTYFVTGNHEYYSGADAWIEKFRQLGMHPLSNAHQLIESEESKIYIAGIHDYTAGRFGHRSDIEQALAGTDPEIPVILLAHQPRSILQAARPQICLQLSGHTHGGQIWPFNYLVHLVQPYVEGLYLHEQTMIYVNRGTGYWGPPMRFPRPSEISELTLTRMV